VAKGEKGRYVCSACGAVASLWTGKCASCGEWGALEKEPDAPVPGASVRSSRASRVDVASVVPPERIPTGLDEFDRVLGGGWVPGGVFLLGGKPGIGKSTLLLQTCGMMASAGHRVLYVSGEESESQVALRARRLESASAGLDLFCDSDLSAALSCLDDHRFFVVDSVQAMRADGAEGWAGSPGQVRASAQMCIAAAKDRGIPAVLVGHITKEGRIAGPMLLEHMVDGVLTFSGDDYSPYRMLRASKNRFGSTDELGVFEMGENGLFPVKDVSGLYWNKAEESVPGVAMTVVLEGTQPLVAEIQSLAAATAFPYPKRTGRGIDLNKIQLFTAVLEKRCGTGCGLFDIYVNVAGGLALREPGADLALCAALASAVRDVPLPEKCVFLGEVGLAGEVRPVVRLAGRLHEAARLGFTRAVVSSREEQATMKAPIDIMRVATLNDALKAVMR
jgi:DNA repair protein RadA/Sms